MHFFGYGVTHISHVNTFMERWISAVNTEISSDILNCSNFMFTYAHIQTYRSVEEQKYLCTKCTSQDREK